MANRKIIIAVESRETKRHIRYKISKVQDYLNANNLTTRLSINTNSIPKDRYHAQLLLCHDLRNK